jgi:Tol biopolymer transport system component
MADDTLQQAISLVKAGKYNEARGLLYHLVKTDPRNEMAWLWLSETMNDAQRLTTLEQALKFNPDSQKLQHSLERLRTRQRGEIASPPAMPAAMDVNQPTPKDSTSAVDRSSIQTAPLTFLPDELPEESPPPAKPAPPPSPPVDRSQIQTAPLPPPPDRIDRSLIRTARLEMPPDGLPPESQLANPPPAATPAPVSSTGVDRSMIQTAPLAYVPEEPAKELPPAAKPVAVPPPAAPPAQAVKPTVQTPSPPDRIDRSILRSTRLDQVSEVPYQTGPLPVQPPAATPPPAKPVTETTSEPAAAMRQQMDALLAEPHPSPDPVLKLSKTSGPPKPPFPPIKEAAITPEDKPRRRFSGIEIGLMVIAVLMVLGIAGFLLWDFFRPKPASPTLAAPVPAATQPTATLAATNTLQAISTPVPPPTLRPTFTPLVSPTPTLNPDSPSVIFFDPTFCAVKQVSAGGGAALVLTNTAPENCLAPELSPDGLKFAYRVQDEKTKSTNSLYVANVNGSSLRAVVDQSEGPVWEVDWAPDNNWLSYTAMVGSNDANPVIGIYLIRADGTGQIQVTNDQTASIIPDSNTTVSWSPDGQWIAFYGDNRPYIVKPDGTGLKQLSDDAGLSIIAWSPDSRQIAYYSSDLNNPGIVVIGVDGKQSFVKNTTLKVPVSGDTLIWTPDGKQFIAYDVARKALVTVSRDGTQIKTLAPVSGIPTRLAWSPDGSQLAYIELPQQDSPSGVLKIITADGTDLKTLITSAANAPLRWKTPANSTQPVTPVPTIKVPTSTSSPTP